MQSLTRLADRDQGECLLCADKRDRGHSRLPSKGHEPTDSIRQLLLVLRRRKLRNPMVLTSRCWCHACHFRQREHDIEHAKSDDENKPYRSSSTAVGQRENRSNDGKFPGKTEHDNVANDAEEAETALGTKSAKELASPNIRQHTTSS